MIVLNSPEPEAEDLASCSQLEANVILLAWQQEQRAFDAQLATVASIMSEPQVAA